MKINYEINITNVIHYLPIFRGGQGHFSIYHNIHSYLSYTILNICVREQNFPNAHLHLHKQTISFVATVKIQTHVIGMKTFWATNYFDGQSLEAEKILKQMQTIAFFLLNCKC